MAGETSTLILWPGVLIANLILLFCAVWYRRRLARSFPLPDKPAPAQTPAPGDTPGRLETWSVLILILGWWAARLVNLDAEPMEGLEFSYFIVGLEEQSLLGLLFSATARELSHQPLSHLLVYGTREISLAPAFHRLVSALIGLPALGITYLLVRELFCRRTALYTVLLVALSPLHFWYSRDISPYALLYLVSVTSYYLLWRGIKFGGRRWWSLYGAVSVFAYYLHFITIVVVFSQCLVVLVMSVRRIRAGDGAGKRVLLDFAITGLAAHTFIIPWHQAFLSSRPLSQAVLMRDKAGLNAFDLPLTIAPLDILRIFCGLPVSLQYGTVLFVGLFVYGLLRSRTDRTTPAGITAPKGRFYFLLIPLLVALAFEYVFLLLVYSFTSGFQILARHMIFLLPFFYAVQVHAWSSPDGESSGRRLARRLAVSLLLISLAAVCARADVKILREMQRPDVRSAAHLIKHHLADGDGISALPTIWYSLTSYYLTLAKPVRDLDTLREAPNVRWHTVTGSGGARIRYFATINDFERPYGALLKACYFERLWVLDYNNRLFSRNDYAPGANAAKLALIEGRYRKVREEVFHDLRVHLYLPDRRKFVSRCVPKQSPREPRRQ